MLGVELRKDVAVMDHSAGHELSFGERLMVCRHHLRLPADEIARRTGIPFMAYRCMEQDVPGADVLWPRLLDRMPILQPIFQPSHAPISLIYAAGPLREAIRAVEALGQDRRHIELTRIRLEVDWWDVAQSA
jgi:hypothetical protein